MSSTENGSSLYWSVKEFSIEHNVSRQTTYAWIKKKIIKAIKVGGRTLIPRNQEIGTPITIAEQKNSINEL